MDILIVAPPLLPPHVEHAGRACCHCSHALATTHCHRTCEGARPAHAQLPPHAQAEHRVVVVVDIVAHVRADVADLSGMYPDVHAKLLQRSAAPPVSRPAPPSPAQAGVLPCPRRAARR